MREKEEQSFKHARRALHGLHKCKICSDARRPFVRTAHKVFCSEQNYNNLKKSNNIIPQTTTESKAFIRVFRKDFFTILSHAARGRSRYKIGAARRSAPPLFVECCICFCCVCNLFVFVCFAVAGMGAPFTAAAATGGFTLYFAVYGRADHAEHYGNADYNQNNF